ncbi:MAG TPA: PIN domain-containing protein [Bryobacteraceae bacterium]|nr:PIN domain-containing protein [Bryobacteraceae bacterium]
MKDLWLVRASIILVLIVASWQLQPFGLTPVAAASTGAVAAALIILTETRVRMAPLAKVIGAVLGLLFGIGGALVISSILAHAGGSSETVRFFQIAALTVGVYLGLVVGAKRGEVLNLAALGGLVGGEKTNNNQTLNVLDTSVIIDGRIADIAETGFLSGVLAIPQFVLRELQLVADSADSLKRNRGRRGLDILQRLQKKVRVEIMEDDFPNIREVDMKLVELGKVYGCKIVTNDFNLNKVAQLNGLQVLNINELANALKPVVLPGEVMRVFVLKEGKEYNQGVAYLDDGTMVVVDNARRFISKTIDISVTSVLQTTAGKMIFGRFDERTHSVYEKAPTDSHHHNHPDRRRETHTATGPVTGPVTAPMPGPAPASIPATPQTSA